MAITNFRSIARSQNITVEGLTVMKDLMATRKAELQVEEEAAEAKLVAEREVRMCLWWYSTPSECLRDVCGGAEGGGGGVGLGWFGFDRGRGRWSLWLLVTGV